MTNVILFDDHKLTHLGLKSFFETNDDIHLVASSSHLDDILSILAEKDVDILLLETWLAEMPAVEVIKKLLKVSPSLKIIGYTGYYHRGTIRQVLQAGAVGYLSKTSELEELIKAIKAVSQDQRYLHPKMPFNPPQIQAEASAQPKVMADLTSREMDILIMLIEGITIHEISAQTSLSESTIVSYRYRIYHKLNVRNDVQLLRCAMQQGLFGIPRN